MFKNKKGVRSFVVMCVLILAFIVNGIFTLGSIRINPIDAWVTQPAVTTDASAYMADYVILEVSATDSQGNTVSTKDEEDNTKFYAWFNVGRIQQANTKDGYGVINLRWKSTADFSTTATSSSNVDVEIKKGVNTQKEQSQYGWYQVELTSFNKYWKISTNDVLEINEVVFTNVDGVVLTTSLYSANEWKDMSDGSVSYTEKKADALSEKSTAWNIVDEQNMFKQYSNMAKKYNFTSEEASVVNSVLTFFNNDGEYVDKTSGVFGLELISIGIAVFGVNTLGVRIIPYFFFVLTVVLLFSFGRKLFNDSDAGLIMAVFYTLFGLGLSVGSVGSVNTIAVFFALLSVYFAYGFFVDVSKFAFTKNKHSFKVGKTALFVPILLSALTFSIAINSCMYSIFVLPAIIAIFVLGLFKIKRIHVKNSSLVEFEDEKVLNDEQYKLNMIGSIIAFVLSFVLFSFIITLLFYGIVGSTYTVFYNTENLFNAIFANLKGSVFGGASISGAFALWLIGGGKSLIYTSENSGVYIAMNIATQIISLASIIWTTIFVVRKVFVGKKETTKASFKTYGVPFILLAVGWLFSWIMFAFVNNTNVADYLFATIFAVSFIALAYKTLQTIDKPLFVLKGKTVSVSLFSLVLAFILALIFNGLGYVMIVGIDVPTIVAKILFGWGLF